MDSSRRTIELESDNMAEIRHHLTIDLEKEIL